MKRWLISVLLAVFLILTVVWAIGSALHMEPEPIEMVATKPNPEGPPLRPHYADECLALKARTEKVVDDPETRTCQVDDDCSYVWSNLCWFGTLIPVNRQGESNVRNALEYYRGNVGGACGRSCESSIHERLAVALCEGNICQVRSVRGKPSDPEYPFDERVVKPQIEPNIDLRGTANSLDEKDIRTPGVISKAKGLPQVVYVSPRTQKQDRCEGYVEIKFEGANDIVNGSYEIVHSKPPAKHDHNALQALFDMYSLEAPRPISSNLATTHLPDGRTERTFRYYMDCDNIFLESPEAD